MGVTEILFIIAFAFILVISMLLYRSNSKKINAQKQKETAEKLKAEQEAKQKEQQSKAETKKVMEDISVQSEDYLKSLVLQEEIKNQNQQQQNSEVQFKEVKKSEVVFNDYKDDAIVLGQKKDEVVILGDDDQDEFEFYENAQSIANDEDPSVLDEEDEIEFEESNTVGEEFKNLSGKMKAMLITNALNKKHNE